MSTVCDNVYEQLNERFGTLIENPIVLAACVFEHSRWPSFVTAQSQLEEYGDEHIRTLLTHFTTLFDYTRREWKRLKFSVMRDESLRSLKYSELYQRLFDQFSEKDNSLHFYNVLLLAVIVQTIAVDTSTCERGFSLMNMLKSVRRSRMRPALLRILMCICSLGTDWQTGQLVPVYEIIDEWRALSNRGRYEGKLLEALQQLDELSDVAGPTSSAASALTDLAIDEAIRGTPASS
mmetsp:Transcript_9875/g.20901  ORF Transcript_9875/g.20901 Transcript_9875/m.20901 type:complete len:235 (-) Transcript_9875:103-807(-)|eukprot:CAMPEP_0182801298 /NCGR_PEP_ID=MMETSP0006_2-20121128/2877_1 /TAXON_ID=97485 /ORGANISM="Prymnesium parvum, Strain Texoma1" /LENGTH=234 /DNA_ID=CAMNT_0024926609 /DNA_START=305 /DNA_END=1009 /DNA_ORIENTATION=+